MLDISSKLVSVNILGSISSDNSASVRVNSGSPSGSNFCAMSIASLKGRLTSIAPLITSNISCSCLSPSKSLEVPRSPKYDSSSSSFVKASSALPTASESLRSAKKDALASLRAVIYSGGTLPIVA